MYSYITLNVNHEEHFVFFDILFISPNWMSFILLISMGKGEKLNLNTNSITPKEVISLLGELQSVVLRLQQTTAAAPILVQEALRISEIEVELPGDLIMNWTEKSIVNLASIKNSSVATASTEGREFD